MKVTQLVLLALVLSALLLTGCAVGSDNEIHIFSDNEIERGSHNTTVEKESTGGFPGQAGAFGAGAFVVFILFLFGGIEVVKS